MAQTSASQTTMDELLRSLGDLLKRYEEEIKAFAEAVDRHVRALEQNPFLESLDALLQQKEQEVKEFSASLPRVVERLNMEANQTLSNFRQIMTDVENKQRELSQAITIVATELKTDGRLSLFDKVVVVDDLADATNTRTESAHRYGEIGKAYQELLEKQVQKHESLLRSQGELLTSFAALLKMREELVHSRLEKHEAFLKSKEDLLKSFKDLVHSYQQLLKEATAPSTPS